MSSKKNIRWSYSAITGRNYAEHGGFSLVADADPKLKQYGWIVMCQIGDARIQTSGVGVTAKKAMNAAARWVLSGEAQKMVNAMMENA